MKKYRIGFLLGSLNGAGAEKTILTISDYISKLNHEVYLFLLSQNGDYQPPKGIHVVEVEGKRGYEK